MSSIYDQVYYASYLRCDLDSRDDLEDVVEGVKEAAGLEGVSAMSMVRSPISSDRARERWTARRGASQPWPKPSQPRPKPSQPRPKPSQPCPKPSPNPNLTPNPSPSPKPSPSRSPKPYPPPGAARLPGPSRSRRDLGARRSHLADEQREEGDLRRTLPLTAKP